MQKERQFREATQAERAILQRLLAVEFPGKKDVAQQVATCRVRIIDDEGSLQLEIGDSAIPAVVNKRVPVEAEAGDEDGTQVHFLLHVVEGFAKELEIYKDDGSPIRRTFCADNLDVIVLPA